MHRISRSFRCWCAVGIWGAGLALFICLAWWNMAVFKADSENRLIADAGRIAAQLAGLAAVAESGLEASTARALVSAAMEDERVYAVKVDNRKKLIAGERRDYMWEPVSWDEEIAENCVQGTNPIRKAGQIAGQVDVWLSPRINAEEESLLFKREIARLGITALIWTGVLCLLLWIWGDYKRFARLFERASSVSKENENSAERLVLGLARQDCSLSPDRQVASKQEVRLVDPEAARSYQRKHPASWYVTAGLFRQTFARAPHLLNRLYSDGQTAGLCHLGHMLEMAAPCIGAMPLKEAAREMQAALNDPTGESRAIRVENCARILERTLSALAGSCNETEVPGKGD